MPGAISPRSWSPRRFAGSEVIRFTASSRVRIPSSRTYFAMTLGNAPKARGWVLVTVAGLMGWVSVSIMTQGARRA
jgi:hypothetical protein